MATKYRETRSNFPLAWIATGIVANQTSAVEMSIVGITPKRVPFAHDGSLISVGIILSAVITAGSITFEITKGGVGTGKTFVMDSTKGTAQIWEFDPGKLPGSKGERLGFEWTSDAALLPDGSLEAVLAPEVQWA